MKVVADGNMAYVKEAFGPIGEVRTFRGREIVQEDVKDADILLVRSVTPVNAELLEESRVRFVATATIGTDHIDQEYLRDKGIGFASAPGTNAQSVAEYIVSALLAVCEQQGRILEGASIAVVGVGNVGSKVAVGAGALGMKVFLNDPPLERQTGDDAYRPLDEAIGCDFVTLHVPLTRDGQDPTFHLVNEAVLRKMSSGSVLINSSRGAVVDGGALLKEIKTERLSAVLDVWEGEPAIDTELLGKAAIGTPHVAGYSFDGKVNATAVIYRAACKFFGIEPSWEPDGERALMKVPEFTIDCAEKSEEDVLREAVFSVYDINKDDAALRKVHGLPEEERGFYFEKLRREYPLRREFFNASITLKNPTHGIEKKLGALGFGAKVNT